MNIVKHRFTSPKSDGTDPTQVQPSHWNDGHAFIGGAAGDVLTRDPADATFGATWAPVGTYGTFTPTDVSGAGLVFGFSVGKWAKHGRVVSIWLQVVYPATANTQTSQIGPLPYVVRAPAGGFQGFGALRLWYFPEGGTTVEIRNTTGLNTFNNENSGANYIVNAVYLTD